MIVISNLIVITFARIKSAAWFRIANTSEVLVLVLLCQKIPILFYMHSEDVREEITSESRSIYQELMPEPILETERINPNSTELASRILARPLFSSDRHPLRSTISGQEHALELPRLSGTITTGGERIAVLSFPGESRSEVVRDGSMSRIGRVAKIGNNNIVISRDGQDILLELRSDPEVRQLKAHSPVVIQPDTLFNPNLLHDHNRPIPVDKGMSLGLFGGRSSYRQ